MVDSKGSYKMSEESGLGKNNKYGGAVGKVNRQTTCEA